MKKNNFIGAVLLGVMVSCLLFGCGNKEDEEGEPETKVEEVQVQSPTHSRLPEEQ